MKISVLTASFNSGKYLERAILSVNNQKYKDFEHIVLDGGSTDNTLDILKKYQHINWTSEPDHGQSDAMNKAFEKSNGEIIVYLNADDELAPDVFDFIVTFFINSPAIDAVVGDLNFVRITNQKRLKSSETLEKIMDQVNELSFPLNPVAYYYRRGVQEKIGPFPIDEHLAMDYWFLLRMYKDFNIHFENKIFGNYYITGENKSADDAKSRTALYRVLRNFIYQFKLHQYDHYLDNFVYESVKLNREFYPRFEILNKQQNSAAYLINRMVFLVKRRISKLLKRAG